MADWANLHIDLLYLIAGRLGQYEDFVSFGGVCRTWRSVATKDSYGGSSAQIPWLMLSEKKGDISRGFYSLSHSKITYRMLPEATGKVCYASRGWLVTVSQKNLRMNLLNPISRVRVRLPDPRMLVAGDPMYETFIKKVVLSASPNSTGGGNYTVSVMYGNLSQLAIWRSNGNFSWTKIELRSVGCFRDLINYQGKLFAMRYGLFHALLLGVDLEDVDGQAKTRILLKNFVGFCAPNWLIEKLYMVECCGELLVVVRQGVTRRKLQDKELKDLDKVLKELEEERRKSRRRRIRTNRKTTLFTYGTTSFKVFKLNLDLSSCSSSIIGNSSWEEVYDLGKRALFLRHSSSFCIDIDASNKSIKPNSIYFTDDVWASYLNEPKPTWVAPEGGGKDMGIYNLKDKTIVPHFEGKSYSRLTPPLWIQPTL